MATELLKMTAQIVTSHASMNELTSQELINEITSVYNTLLALAGEKPVTVETPGELEAAPEVSKPKPAVPVEESIQDDYIVCLECGRKQKVLKRHLGRTHGLGVAAYRTKWSLPSTYPIVAPEYAARRSELARAIGLGRPRQAPKRRAQAAAVRAAKAGVSRQRRGDKGRKKRRG